MKINIEKNFRANFITGVLYRMLAMLAPFIIRTIIIKKLGLEYAGVSSLFTSVLQALSLAELGFGSAMVFNMYTAVANNDKDKLCAYTAFYRKVYRIIGLVVLSAGLCILPFIKHLIKGSYPQEINIYVIYLIYLLNTVLSYWFFAYKNSVALAYQRTDISLTVSIIAEFLLYGFQIWVLAVFKDFYIYAILLPLSTVLKNILTGIWVDRKYKDIRPEGELGRTESKKIFDDVKALFGHQVAFTVINSVDNMVISRMLGLDHVTIYNNYYYIINAAIGIMTMFFHSLQAGIGNDLIVNEEGKYKNFKRFRLTTILVIQMGAVCIYAIMQEFIRIWMGEKLMMDEGFVLLFVIGFYVTQVRRIVTTYKNAAGMWKQDMIKPYIVIAVDLILDLILIYRIDSRGAMLSTIISMGLIALPWETIVLYKGLFKKNPFEYFGFLLYHTMVLAFSLLIVWKAAQCFTIGGIPGLIIRLGCVVIFESIVLLLFNISNKDMKWMIDKALGFVCAWRKK